MPDSIPPEILRISIDIEMALSELYRTFSDQFPDDRALWRELSVEEVNHASILRTGEKLPGRMFPPELLAKDLPLLRGALEEIRAVLERCESSPPAREEALRLALDYERGAGELHYQMFMRAGMRDDIGRIYQDLNAGDLDHGRRIAAYMTSLGFKLRPGGQSPGSG